MGMAGLVGTSWTQSRRSGFAIAAAFFAGIVVNLTVLGALAGRLGIVMTESFGRYWALAMALVSLLAAVVAFRGPRMKIDTLAALRKPGLVGAFGYGFLYSIGTSAAPLLVFLTVAAAQASALHGLLLAFAFGIGRGFPFLLVSLFAGLLIRVARISLWRRAIQVVSGCALVVVSLYYVRVFASLL
jgi:cytochrome c-type biogenesis protein